MTQKKERRCSYIFVPPNNLILLFPSTIWILITKVFKKKKIERARVCPQPTKEGGRVGRCRWFFSSSSPPVKGQTLYALQLKRPSRAQLLIYLPKTGYIASLPSKSFLFSLAKYRWLLLVGRSFFNRSRRKKRKKKRSTAADTLSSFPLLF